MTNEVEEQKVQEQLVVLKRECENKGSEEDCAWWKEQGYCTDETYKDAMAAECPCSCGERQSEQHESE